VDTITVTITAVIATKPGGKPVWEAGAAKRPFSFVARGRLQDERQVTFRFS
jgi:hypothetical protein